MSSQLLRIIFGIFIGAAIWLGGLLSMAEDSEKSEGGSAIYRHGAKEHSFTAPEHSGRNLAAVEAHVEKHIGKIETVYHEILSDRIHLDVLFVPANDERPYHTLVTSGVSDLPMQVPEGMEAFNRVELLMALPPEWPLTQEAFQNENHFWPVRWLKNIGRLPHDYDTWIGWGHTIPNNDPPETIANTQFIGVMLSPAFWLNDDFYQLTAESGNTITFYNLVPLYQEEMDLKLQQGADEIEDRLDRRKVGFVLDIARPNVAVKPKKFWWP